MTFNEQQIKGLNVAAQRRAIGGADFTDADRKNLAYAESKGWKWQPEPPKGMVAIPGAQYNTREKQQAAFSNIQPVGNTLYGIPIPNQLTPEQLGGNQVAPVEPATFGDVDAMMAGVNTGNDGLRSILEQYNTQLASQGKKDEMTKRLETFTEQEKTGQRDLQEQMWSRFGLDQNAGELQKLMPQIAKTQAEFENFSVAQEGRTASASSIYGRQALIQRQKAVELAGLSAVAQAYQGNVDMARNIAQDAINAKYQDYTNYYNGLSDQIEYIKEDLTREDQQRVDSLNLVIQERQRLIEEEKAKELSISNIMMTAAENGADTSTLSAIMGATNEKEAILKASKFLNINTDTTIPQKIGTDQNGSDLYYDPISGSVKTALQLTNNNLGTQVGTIKGLPSYATRAANPGMTRSDRNNNPGNIKVSDYTKEFEGVIGVESDPAADGGNFLIFENAEAGINAIGRLLLEGKSYQGVNAETAIKKYNGNGGYGALNVGLDPNKDFQSQIQDPTKRFEVAMAIAKAEGWSGGVATELSSPEAKSWANLISEGKAKIENVPQDMRDRVATELSGMTTEAEKMNDELAKAKAQSATDLISHKGLDSSTGTTRLGRTAALWNMGAKRDFIAGVEQLISGLSLESLISAKSRGATFGALSDSEMRILSSAASKIGSWAKRDETGKVVGYVIDEGSMKRELKNISDNLNNAIKKIDPLGIGTSQEIDPLGILN